MVLSDLPQNLTGIVPFIRLQVNTIALEIGGGFEAKN
jgi:hypothetical protein